MRVPSPIKRCHTSGKYGWTCPDCRQQAYYGFTDEYLYCQCARYPYSLAAFKCRNHVAHGKDYVKYENADLLKLLKLLKARDSRKKYNILILGETGVGKSMFVNAFHNY
jgi:DNA replication protein DnaC